MVQEQKCTFVWQPDQSPTISLPDDRRLRCIAKKFVAYLEHDQNEEVDEDGYACPGVEDIVDAQVLYGDANGR